MPNNKWWILVSGILLGLLSAGLIIIFTSSPRGKAIELPPAPTTSPIMVDISGEIYTPGLYSLPINSRVADLIALAGGLLPNAHLDSINLAQFLEDGQRIFIASMGQSSLSNLENALPGAQIVNINIANIEVLSSLPGIGEGKAADIINYRQQFGAFASIQGIMNVPGIGEGTFKSIQKLISISSSP
jgi:competence protein ComEA